ncbi:MAG TPA: oligosaccharide flippase family protein [Longimicrobiaceae bacterium]
MSPDLEPSPLQAPAAGAERWGERVRRLGGSRFARQVGETLGTRVFLLGLSVATNVLLARALGPAGRGYHAVATAVTAMGVQAANLGLHSSNTYSAARDPSAVPHLFANSLLVGFGGGGAAAAAAFAFFLLRPDLAPVYGWVAVLGLAAVPFALTYLLLQSLLLGMHEVRAYNGIDAAVSVVSAALVVGLVAAGRVSVTALMACALAVSVVSFGWAAARVQRNVLSGPHEPERPSWPLFRTTLRYGSKAYLAALFAYLAQRADVFMLTRMLGSEETGYYAAAVSVAAVASVFPSVIGTILFPRLSSTADAAERWRFTLRVLGIAVAGMAVVAAGVVLLAPRVVLLLFGEAFMPAVAPLRWLMPGVLVLSANSILMNYFASIGMPRITVLSPALATVVNVGLNLALIPRLGITGAALASVAAYGTMLLASLVYLSLGSHREAR